MPLRACKRYQVSYNGYSSWIKADSPDEAIDKVASFLKIRDRSTIKVLDFQVRYEVR